MMMLIMMLMLMMVMSDRHNTASTKGNTFASAHPTWRKELKDNTLTLPFPPLGGWPAQKLAPLVTIPPKSHLPL